MLAEFIYCRFEAARQFVRWSRSPIVQEVDGRLCLDHVVMNGHDVQPVLAKRLQHRPDPAGQHRHVTRNGGILIRSDERRPRVETSPLCSPSVPMILASFAVSILVVADDAVGAGAAADCGARFVVLPIRSSAGFTLRASSTALPCPCTCM